MSRNAVTMSGEIDSGSQTPTWEEQFPRLFIKPAEMFTDSFGAMTNVVVDNFYESAITALTAHTSDPIDGIADMPWTARVSAMVIAAGTGKVTANPSGTPALSTKTFTSANVVLKEELTISAQTTNALILRYLDTTHYWRVVLVGGVVNQLQLVKVNGTGSIVSSYTNAGTITSGSTHTVEARVNGNAFEIYLDGVLRISTSDSFQNTQAIHGIQLNDGSTAKFQARLN